MLRGIDVSSHQPAIDWGRVAKDYQFAIVKCCGGAWYRNPRYADQLAGARGAGLVVGHYHFAHEGENPGPGPEVEAEYFLRNADVRPGELVALDIEDTGVPGDLSDWALTWLTMVEGGLGVKPLIYSFPNYIQVHNLGTAALARYPLWYASYRTPYAMQPWPRTPRQWPKISIWQWSGGTRVPGIPNDTDDNLFDGTREELLALGVPMKPTGGEGVAYGINERGETVVTVNFGGEATGIQGVNFADLGVSVTGTDGATYDRSLVAGQFQPWQKRS